MFTQKSGLCLKGAKRKNSLENSQFIQKVREEDRRDKILEDVFMRSTEENPYHKKIQSCVQLCEGLKKEKQTNFLIERRDLLRRQNYDSLTLLERQLRAAYVSKAIAAQKFEQAALVKEHTAKRVYENNGLEEARMRETEYLKKRDEEIRKKKAALKQDLLEQIAEMDAKRQEEKTNIIRDRQMIDNIVKKYREEDEQEERDALAKKIKVNKDMVEFQEAQDKWKLQQSKATEQEEVKNAEFSKQRDIEKERLKQMRRDLQERKNKLSEEIGLRTHAIAVEKVKTMEVLTELLIDERKAKEEMKFRNDLERQMRERIAVREDLKSLRETKERQRLEQKREDEELYQEELRLLSERDKKQKLADEIKRKEKLEHREALLNALNEKKRFRTKEMKRLLVEDELERADAKRRDRMVELERHKMLMEHAPSVKGFFPLRKLSRADREILSL